MCDSHAMVETKHIDIDPRRLPAHHIPAIYKQVGARIEALSEDDGEGTLSIRPNLRSLNGPSAAALAVLLQDLSAVTIARFAPLVVPIQINVRILAAARDTAEVFARGTTLRRGRAVQATDAAYFDGADRTRLVGFATGSWATMASNLDEPRPTKYGPGTPQSDDPGDIWDFATLIDAIGGGTSQDGTAAVLAAVPAEATEPIALGGTGTGTLHAGALQVLAEHAAVLAATGEVDGSDLMIQQLSTQFLAPARQTPLHAKGRVISSDATSLDVRVEVRESAGEGRVAALTYARFARI
jgi:acyl-coenzyme A thioesterase PaaI-like protein